MQSEEHQSLQAEFDAAYIFPLAKYPWRSRRARSSWLDLEGWQDALAGPVYSIVQNGNCAYVYARDDEFFVGVVDPAALDIRLREWHAKLTAGLDHFVPATEAEEADFEAMRLFASQMWAVAEKAIEIERLRWKRQRADI